MNLEAGLFVTHDATSRDTISDLHSFSDSITHGKCLMNERKLD